MLAGFMFGIALGGVMMVGMFGWCLSHRKGWEETGSERVCRQW
jgi:hypothetical protein